MIPGGAFRENFLEVEQVGRILSSDHSCHRPHPCPDPDPSQDGVSPGTNAIEPVFAVTDGSLNDACKTLMSEHALLAVFL